MSGCFGLSGCVIVSHEYRVQRSRAIWSGSIFLRALQLSFSPLCILHTDEIRNERKSMKNVLRVGAAIAAISMMTAVRAGGAPGEIDLGKFTPAPGAQFVEVNINSNLIAMAMNFAKKAEPEVVEVLQGLKSVRVNVLGLTEENRAEIQEKVTSLRSQLSQSGWDRVVTVMDKADDVGVFIKTKGADVVEGLVVTVLSGNKEAVFVNVVGDIRPDRLAAIGERFNIEPLKHLPKPAAKNE